MSYIINKTNGSVLSTSNIVNGTLLDGTIDASTGVSLIGRNFPNYGEVQNENFVRLLENFADANPPTISLAAVSALTGTIWYDTVNKKLRVYDGTDWNIVGLPAGALIQWNTLLASVPPGFQLCNGTNGTPDLTAQTISGTGYSISYIQKIS
jgi:hypothetical protein